MKTIRILFVLFCFSSILQAQINLKEAYIISNDGDTITGYIDFRTNKINATQCLFKQTLDAESVIYKPGDIEGYRFINEGKKYVSSIVEIDGEERSLFLEYLLKGVMSLYYYQDDKTNQEYYLFEDESGKLTEITKIADYRHEYERRVIQDRKYIGKLLYLFKDTPSIFNRPETMRFDRKEMINIVEKYHKEVCTTGEECIEYENQYNENRLKVAFSVFGGVNFYGYRLGFEGSSRSASKVTPTIGVQLHLMNPRWSKSISVQIEGALTQLKSIREGFEIYAPAENKALVWNTSFSPKYTYSKGRIRPTVELGLNTSLLFSKSSKLKPKGKYLYDPNKDRKLDDFQAFFVGVHSALGVDCQLRDDNFVFLRFGYDWNYSTSQISSYGGDVLSGFSIKTGYTF